MLAGLKLVLSELVGGHLDDILLVKNAGLALTLAGPAVGDGRAVLDAILACGRKDVPTIGPHSGAAACILLLRKLGAPRLLGGPALKIFHPPIKLGVEGLLVPTKVIGVDESDDRTLAFASRRPEQ